MTDRPAEVARHLAARFRAAKDAKAYFAIVDRPLVRQQLLWIRARRKDLWLTLRPALMEAWRRVYPEGQLLAAAAKDSVHRVMQGELL